MRWFPDVTRLRWVRDVCLLPGHAHVPHEATAYYTATFIDPGPLVITERSVSVTVVSNRILTWHRTFTKDGAPPPKLYGRSLIHLNEWIPWHMPAPERRKGFARIGPPKYKGIAWLHEGDHTLAWSEQARRHLRAFQKAKDIVLRPGTLEELLPAYSRSQVPTDMQEVFVQETNRHLAAHPERVDIMVAEHATLGIVAGFVGANCDEAKQSVYLLGFFLPEAEKMHPMTGLFDWWFKRCKDLGYRACNFGNMSGPQPFAFDPSVGYSNFKTHFGVTRLVTPGSYWRLSLGSK